MEICKYCKKELRWFEKDTIKTCTPCLARNNGITSYSFTSPVMKAGDIQKKGLITATKEALQKQKQKGY